jgi:hypothetical protein
MTESEWDVVVRNNRLLYGYCIDVENNEIKMARRPGEYHECPIAPPGSRRVLIWLCRNIAFRIRHRVSIAVPKYKTTVPDIDVKSVGTQGSRHS